MAYRKKIKKISAFAVIGCARHRNAVRFTVLALLILSLLALFYGHFSNDISKMLPDHSASARSYTEIARSGMFNKLVIVLFRSDGTPFRESGLIPIWDRIAENLQKNPHVKTVDYRMLSGDFSAGIRELPQFLPQLSAPPSGEGKEYADRTVRGVQRRLMTPGAIGQTELLRGDPFGLTNSFFGHLNRFREIAGMRLSWNDSYLVSEDGRRVMLLLDTDIPVSDPSGSRTLLNAVEKELKLLPSSASYELITAHQRAVCNEIVLRKDINLVCWVSVVLFTVLFFLFYRSDARSFLIPAIPAAASVMVLGGMTLLFENTLFFIAGMGGIVISLAVDYGIHTYAVMTGSGHFLRLVRLVPALCAGALTSVAAFVLFLFSGTEASRQLGFFAAASLLFSLILMLLFLPAFLTGKHRAARRFAYPERVLRYPGLILTAWGLIFLGSVCAVFSLRFHADIRQFDVSPDSLRLAEESYAKNFLSEMRPALLLFQGNDPKQVADEAKNTLSILRSKTSIPFFSPLDLYPPESVRRENRKAWEQWISSGKCGELRISMQKSAVENGLPKDFFSPFFDAVERGTVNFQQTVPALFDAPVRRFQSRAGSFYTLAVLFPDTPDAVASVQALTKRTIVSQNGLAASMSEDVLNSILGPGIAALFLVVLITVLFFRRIGDAVLALLPVVTSLAVTGAFFVFCGVGINLSVLIAGIILAGLSVDYGIFMISSFRNGHPDKGLFHAVTLSAVTSAAGGATVLFTTHPMLRYAGITLMIGITTAWLTAVFVLPALKRMPFFRSISILCALSGVFLFGGCSSCPFEYETLKGNPLPEEIRARNSGSLLLESRVTAEYRFFSMSFLSLTRVDKSSDRIEVAAFSPAGVKIFDLAGTPEHVERSYWIPGKEWQGKEEYASRMILADLAAVYGLFPENFSSFRSLENGKKLLVTDRFAEYIYAGSPARLVEKNVWKNGEKVLRVGYYRYRESVPIEIYVENLKYGYRLVIRTIRAETDSGKGM